MGLRLKELRREKGISQKELATIMNVAQNTISNWENENRGIDSKTLAILADLLNVSVDYLLGIPSSDITVAEPKNHASNDIADDLDLTLKRLMYKPDGLMFNGSPLNEETRSILISTIQHTIELSARFVPEKRLNTRKKIDEFFEEYHNQ